MDWIEEIPMSLLEWSYTAPEAQPFGSNIKNIGTWNKSGVDVHPEQHEMMWSHIEAIVHAARHAGRSDLLLDLPVDLANRLRLVFSFELTNQQTFRLGPEHGKGCMGWSSFSKLYQNIKKEEHLGLIKDLVEVFGDSPQIEETNSFCTSCGVFPVALVETIDGSSYCRGCWSSLIGSCTVKFEKLADRSSSAGKLTHDDRSSVGAIQRCQISILGFSSGPE